MEKYFVKYVGTLEKLPAVQVVESENDHRKSHGIWKKVMYIFSSVIDIYSSWIWHK